MAEETVTGYRFPGDIEVKHVLIVSQTGQVKDIGKITLEVNIFQNLNEHYIQAELVVSDSIAMLEGFNGDRQRGIQGGYNGGEVVIVSYKTRDKTLPFKTHFFGLYDLTERQRVDEKNEVYILNCVSAEAYRSASKTISRAFGGSKGNLISNMVRTVINEFIYDRQIKDLQRNYRDVLNIRIEKEVNVDQTNGVQRLLIPNMTPDDTLDFFAREADNDNHIPYFMFYEDSHGFNFRDLNNLVLAEPKETYTYVSTNVEEDTKTVNYNKDKKSEATVRDYQKIISYNVIRQTNILGNVKSGLFRSRMINIDILKKNKFEYNFNYEKEYEKFNKLQKWRIPAQVDGEPILYMMQSRTGHDVCCPIFEKENHLPKRVNQNIQRRQSYMRHIFNTLMEVTVVGNSELDVGDVIELNIPNATTINKKDGKKDKYLSGKYLITSLRHKFGGTTGTEFTTFIECVKDTGIEI
jgi:hypothetical protein